jgi:hypothetical protein
VIITFDNYKPQPREDGIPWSVIVIQESADGFSAWNEIDRFPIDPVDVDPAQPAPRSFTTENGTLVNGWYQIQFLDVSGNIAITEPRQNVIATEIMASLDDINANLDGDIVVATADNTKYIQVSVARVIRAYLSRIIDNTIIYAWTTPDLTPDPIRESAAKLIAAQLYMEKMSRSTTEIPATHYAQILYNQVFSSNPIMPGIMNQIITGDIPLPNIVTTPIEGLTTSDFFPIDATDRAFTMGLKL